MKFALFIFNFLILTSLAKAEEVVVLVPGFFNSLAPGYFSEEIVNSLTSRGLKVYVTHKLNPIGTIEDNGLRLENFLKSIQQIEKKQIHFNIIAHSAGGFYSLWVANRQQVSIKNLYTISTPYKGVEFIQTWINNCSLFKALTEFAQLESLKQLTASGAEQFLKSIRVPPQTKIFAFAGKQSEDLDITDARNLSAPLLVTSHFISYVSDGIVAFQSGLGLGQIKNTNDQLAPQFKDSKYFISLDHWEQVIDSRAFLILGTRNIDYIQVEQIRFYSGLADYIKKQEN